jgi:AraC family transcriptional regulator, transcriptional activator of pobA
MSEHSSSRHRVETTESYSEIYLEAKTFIEENVASGTTLNDFVKAKGLPARSIQRALSWHSTNWRRMLLDERMMRAKEALRSTRDPINTIAEQVGYNQHSQFSRTFLAEEGVTPEEYRSMFRQ